MPVNLHPSPVYSLGKSMPVKQAHKTNRSRTQSIVGNKTIRTPLKALE